jgi:hypothetical protein
LPPQHTSCNNLITGYKLKKYPHCSACLYTCRLSYFKNECPIRPPDKKRPGMPPITKDAYQALSTGFFAHQLTANCIGPDISSVQITSESLYWSTINS